ncbi:centrosomal protein of 135 kDa isoform X3 [Gadus morhua]|uniref:centrosomal protein of 135 kDa isoform X3 n=1 Tax=Gadus morhua TaxID=8049 RepID=UPI0011B636AA|nr:centrosomal protein of 135 kDa isoform X3 [Gadus morhua]
MSTTAERKFLSLRRRLDQLGYRQPLGIETLPLVEQLFSDMIHTTESLRNAKLSAGKTEKEGRNFDALLEPYKTDNARVVKENNELHLALLRLKEDKDRVFRELKSHVRKQENDTTDLKFLNNQYVQKVRCLEKDSKTKSERIQQLQEKNMQAVVQTPGTDLFHLIGGKKRSIPFRRQRMQIDELTPPPATSAYPVPQPDDPYIADLLQMADMRIQELQEEIMMVKLDLEKSQDCMEQLNQQIQGSDKEVQRLNHALSGGRPHDVISLEAQNVSNEKMIAHLNLQIEYLQAANSSMEQKVEAAQQRKQDASSEFADLSVKNHELCQELSHIDHLAKQLEMDKELALQKAHQELQEAQEIQRHQNTIEDLKNVIQTIRRDQSDGDYERNRLSDQLVEVQQQRDQLEGLGNFMEQDKARLQDKLEKMTANDRELVLELETMRAKHGICRKERSPSRLDAFVRSLEEERDHYRKVAEHYKRVRRPESLSLSPIRSPGQESSPNSRRRRSPGEAELVRVAKERDDLKSILLGIERHMEDIQTDVQALRVERDQLKAQLKQQQEELGIGRSAVGAPDEISRLRKEREKADSELQLVTSERDVLMERFKVSQSATLTERRQDERRIEELENNIKSLEQERRELRSQLLVLKENREAEEEELQTRSRALVHTAEELAQHRAESSNLRLLQEQMEHLLSDVQRRLSVKTNELHATQMHITQLEERLGALSGVGSSHKEEVAALHKSITALDQEKDTLQDEVDLKTERLVKLQEELARKEEPLDDLRITVTNMDNSLRQLKGCVGSRDRELASLRRQLDSAQGEVVEHGRAKDMVVRENRRLQEDLATLTRENQTLHAEMEEAMHEKDELKSRVLSYISEVARIEKLITTKEQESQDLLERFRLAHTTLEERDQKLQQAQGLTSSIRLELLSSDTERRHLRQTISHQETEIQQHMHALQAYDAQVSSLARGMARLEEDLKGAQEEKAALLSDLASVRELCVKLDSGKELTACHLTSKSMELERLTGELDDVRSEGELLKKQLASERQTAHNLEALLSNNRQKEFQSHLSASEKESELRVLRERLALADSKTAGHAREVSQLRGRVSQLQTEMDILKRQLTTERFERERAVQEMRRQGVSFSSLRSSSPLSPQPPSPEHSILRTPDRSAEKLPEKSVSFKA